METIRGMGSAVGEYVGGGQGELSTMEALTSVDVEIEAAEPGLDDQSQNNEEVSSDDAHPLLIFHDCETTGLSIYNEHITDVGAKVVASPVPLETPTFSSLVATSRHISPTGTVHIRLRVNVAVMIIFFSYQDNWYQHYHSPW